jgi:cysteine desulfurase
MSNFWGNPSAQYKIGDDARLAVQEAREKIARTLGCLPSEIYFTSGGSESDNWALKGIAHEYQVYGRHIITTAIEHKAILRSCRWLQKQGFDVSYVEPDERGYINPNDIRDLLRDDTILVSVMTANNEIGTIQPIEEIGRICREHGVLFHTDAVQAYGHIRMNVEKLGV